MNSSVELKEEITFDEFKAWMNGLLRGTGKNCPGAEDWRAIYKMMDKVVPDKEEQTQYPPVFAPYSAPEQPWYSPPSITDPIVQPTYVGDVIPNPWEVTCSYDGSATGFAIGSSASVSGENSFAMGVSSYNSGCYGGYSVPQDVPATVEITSSTPLAVSTIAPSIKPYEESETVKQLFGDIEKVRQEMYELTGIKKGKI